MTLESRNWEHTKRTTSHRDATKQLWTFVGGALQARRAQGSPLDPTQGPAFNAEHAEVHATPRPTPASFLPAGLTLRSGSSEPSALGGPSEILGVGGHGLFLSRVPEEVCLRDPGRDAGLSWGRAPPPAGPPV